MKKYLFLLLALSPLNTYALPVGNPMQGTLLSRSLWLESPCETPCPSCYCWCNKLHLQAGYSGDFIFNRYLKNEDAIFVGQTKIRTNAFYLSLNVTNRFDLYATFGLSNIWIKSSGDAFDNTTVGATTLVTDNHFSYSVGSHLTLWNLGATFVGLEAQYFSTAPKIRHLYLASSSASTFEELSSRYHEGQIGLGIAHRFAYITPYAAVKYSYAQYNLEQGYIPLYGFFMSIVRLPSFKLQEHVGFALGFSLVDSDSASLTAEGRWGDERALHLNGQIRF